MNDCANGHHDAKASVEAFEATTVPMVKDGEPARQFGARLANCKACNSTLVHPADHVLVAAWISEQDRLAQERKRAERAIRRQFLNTPRRLRPRGRRKTVSVA